MNVVMNRKLLVLLDGLGEDSRWRTEFERSGNWPVITCQIRGSPRSQDQVIPSQAS